MPNKNDSNFTNLRIAEEETIGVLPVTPVWYPFEPNSYNDFGGELTLLARNPINSSRQRKKGVITDLDASGGFIQDFTQSGLYRVLQGFMFADWQETVEFDPTNIDGASEEYDVPSTYGVLIGSLLYSHGFDAAANNGLKVVDGVTFNSAINVAENLTADAAPNADARLKLVGYQFGSGILSASVTGGVLTLNASGGATYAVNTLTLAANPGDGETVTIGDKVYAFESGAIDAPYKVDIKGSASLTIDALIAAIMGTGTPGVDYGTGTEPHTLVSAVAGAGDTMDVTALFAGVAGNSIPTTETLSDGSSVWDTATMTTGAGVDLTNLGLFPGQWLWVGGDGAGLRFATEANRGLVRIAEVNAASIVTDKQSGNWATEGAGALTVQVFWGDFLHNRDSADEIVRRTYQMERTLDQGGSEYLVGSVPATFELGAATADKLISTMGFISMDNEQRTVNDGVKTGTRPSLVEEDCFNTSSDFLRLRLAKSDGSALFAFVQEFTVSIDNSVTPNKAISVLGAFDITAGTFTVDGSITAYFADVTATQAVRNNDDVSLDFTVCKDNAGWTFDLPHIALGGGRLDVQQDQPIMVPLNTAAARHPTLGYTLGLCRWSYFPDLAA